MHGLKSRQMLLDSLNSLAEKMSVPLPDWSTAVPAHFFQEDGALLSQTQALIKQLCIVAYVRIVDKHASALWGFCKQWASDAHVQFAATEGYKKSASTAEAVTRHLRQRVLDEHWQPGSPSRIALMYLLGTAKSTGKAAILWRPIAAASRPFISRHPLRVAACAFACFLHLLVDTITASILVLNVSDISAWMQHLHEWGAELVGEANCKEQFNRINPSTTVRELTEASEYPRKAKRWGSRDLWWSVHRDSKKLDRAGKASSSAFWHLSHRALTRLVQFSLIEDNHVCSAGALWCREDAIPMGGSFSAQCADLHSVWGLFKHVSLLKQFGTLIQQEPIPLWQTARGNVVNLSQFRDNVNVAAKGPSAASEMGVVCSLLAECWDLPVVCDCITEVCTTCTGACMQRSLRLLGLTLHVGECSICYSSPSSLTGDWTLKWGPSLRSSWTMAAFSLCNIFIGSLVNALPFFFP